MAVKISELEQSIHAALETYSNVHRGSGYNAVITTKLFEQARETVLEYLGLKKGEYIVIFCTRRRGERLTAHLPAGSFKGISGKDLGLSIGVVALAVKKSELPKGIPAESGGGTTKLISRNWVIWGDAPDRFEAGTPAIINIIALARALQLVKQYGKESLRDPGAEKISVNDLLHNDKLDKFSGTELLAELRKTLVGRGMRIPTKEGEKPFINFDNSASTRTFEPVWDAFRKTLNQPAEVQKDIVRETKSVCAGFLNAPLSDYEVIFTSNTTEAINLAAESLGKEAGDGHESVVVNTLLEHSSNDLPWRMLSGNTLIRLSISKEGFIDLNELETLLREYNQEEKHGKKRIRLVAVSGASNVLGSCNDIAAISSIVHQYGARLFVDGAQLVAHRRVDMQACNIDYLAFSAHKIYAPFGSGALVVKKGLLRFDPDEMSRILDSGEENAAGIAALGKSIILLERIGMEVIREDEQVLTAHALRGLAKVKGLQLFGVTDPASAAFPDKLGVFVFRMKGKMPNSVAKKLADQGGIGIRWGCHCSHILVKHLLGLGPKLEQFQKILVTVFPMITLPGLARVSLGIENTKEEVDCLVETLGKL